MTAPEIKVPVEPLYVRIETAAAMIEVSRATVYRWAQADPTFPAFTHGSVVRVHVARFRRWLEQRTARPRPSKATRNGLDGHVDGHTAGAGETAQVGGSK
jgi:predicted DNA-binding transcriptional regulator AlpA